FQLFLNLVGTIGQTFVGIAGLGLVAFREVFADQFGERLAEDARLVKPFGEVGVVGLLRELRAFVEGIGKPADENGPEQRRRRQAEQQAPAGGRGGRGRSVGGHGGEFTQELSNSVPVAAVRAPRRRPSASRLRAWPRCVRRAARGASTRQI